MSCEYCISDLTKRKNLHRDRMLKVYVDVDHTITVDFDTGNTYIRFN